MEELAHNYTVHEWQVLSRFSLLICHSLTCIMLMIVEVNLLIQIRNNHCE